MVNKKKVLLYGNCQLTALGRMLQLQTPKFNEEYEILNALNYNLPSVWRPEIGTVANWNTENRNDINNIIENTNKITEDADIIIFQNDSILIEN